MSGVNTKLPSALRSCFKRSDRAWLSSSAFPVYNTLNVLTTTSFAAIPVSKLTLIFQSNPKEPRPVESSGRYARYTNFVGGRLPSSVLTPLSYLFFLRIQLRIFDLRYLAIKLISALRMSGEIPKEPDDDRSDQDDTSHLVQVLFRFLPHMDHDGFAGRHPIGGSSITKGTSSSLNRKRLKRRAMITASKIPDTYKANNTKLAFFGKNAPVSNT